MSPTSPLALGIGAMVLPAMDAAHEAAHHWIVALFWGCLAFFVVEWGVRVQQAALKRRTATDLLSGRDLLDTVR